MNLKSKIAVLEQKIARLEREFNQYFTGQESRPPLQKLEKLKAEINNILNQGVKENKPSAKFMIETFINKFTTYRTKWERGVRDIEEGRSKPGTHFFGGLGKSLTADALKEKSDFSKIKNMDSIEKEIKDASKQFVDLSAKHTKQKYNAQAVEETLRAKISEIKKKYGDNFTFKVHFDGSKVRIKPVKK